MLKLLPSSFPPFPHAQTPRHQIAAPWEKRKMSKFCLSLHFSSLSTPPPLMESSILWLPSAALASYTITQLIDRPGSLWSPCIFKWEFYDSRRAGEGREGRICLIFVPWVCIREIGPEIERESWRERQQWRIVTVLLLFAFFLSFSWEKERFSVFSFSVLTTISRFIFISLSLACLV